MTIAIGLPCADGILLGADSEIARRTIQNFKVGLNGGGFDANSKRRLTMRNRHRPHHAQHL
jgi:hypothetical protein